MDRYTLDHLQAAEQNRALALALLDPTLVQVGPRRWEWTGVIAFYAAVHYVNAYLWEVRRFAPAPHPERSRAVRSEAGLRPAGDSYELLRDYAYEARYTATFTATEADARELVQFDLRRVEESILRALGLDVPTWGDLEPR